MILTHLQQRLAALLAHLPEQQADAALRLLVEAWNHGRHEGLLTVLQRVEDLDDRARLRAELLPPDPNAKRPQREPW